MRRKKQDLVVIGGGIMGIMTAYYASLLGRSVTILEKLTIGNKEAASFSITRSIRNDYLDPQYSKLAWEARKLWDELEAKIGGKFILNCGCLNLAKKTITPGLKDTYAEKSYNNITDIGLKSEKFTKTQLKKRFPQFSADIGRLDVMAGFLYLPKITFGMMKLLKKQKVKIVENVTIKSIEDYNNGQKITTNKGQFVSKKIVVVSGLGTNKVLKLIKNCKTQFPLRPDRPSECKYYIPNPKDIEMFKPKNFPVFAYLDIGIYGHPIYNSKTKGVKIGYYNPADIKKVDSPVKNIQDFVDICLPILKKAKSIDVTNADQCYYDMVEDDEFILGPLPYYKNIFVGVGWRGTGYKFAPLIGKVLTQLSLQSGTIYDIGRFSPARFTKSSSESVNY